MYNDNCKTAVPCGDVPVPVDSMKNTILEIHDHAMKARGMAIEIHSKLFGTPTRDTADANVECAFDALLEINEIEKDTLEFLYAVIQRIGE